MKYIAFIVFCLILAAPVTAQPNRLIAGSFTASTTSQILPDNRVTQVVVQNDPDNSVNIFVNGIELSPGEALTIPCENTNHVSVSAETSTAEVNFLARRE
jgi:hypothetical protein